MLQAAVRPAAVPPLERLERAFPQFLVTLPDGARVAVRECGAQPVDAPALVLLHGISSGAASWLDVAVRLQDTCRVIAWDAPGYGHSDPLTMPAPKSEDYAHRLLEVLDALGVRRCVLVGHSLGALMAAAAVRLDRAGAIRRLVLVSPAGGYGGDDRQSTRERVRQERSDALAQLGVTGLAQRIDQRLLSPAADDSARAWVRWNTARLHPAGYLQAVQMLCESRMPAAPLPVPVEMLCGEADTVTSPAACAELARGLGIACQPVAGAGHASPIEQPDAVARTLRRALQMEMGEHHA